MQKYLSALPERQAAVSQPEGSPDSTAQKKKSRRKPKGNQPAFPLAAELQPILGVDATASMGWTS